MATAEVIRSTPKPQPLPPVEEVVLRLSKDEAETLFEVLGRHTGRWDNWGDVATAIRNVLYAHSTGGPGRFSLS